MVRTKYIATPALLLQALLRAKHLKRIKNTDHPPSTVSSSVEEASPFTMREGLSYECNS